MNFNLVGSVMLAGAAACGGGQESNALNPEDGAQSVNIMMYGGTSERTPRPYAGTVGDGGPANAEQDEEAPWVVPTTVRSPVPESERARGGEFTDGSYVLTSITFYMSADMPEWLEEVEPAKGVITILDGRKRHQSFFLDEEDDDKKIHSGVLTVDGDRISFFVNGVTEGDLNISFRATPTTLKLYSPYSMTSDLVYKGTSVHTYEKRQ